MPTIRCKEKIRNRLFMKKLWERGKREEIAKKNLRMQESEEKIEKKIEKLENKKMLSEEEKFRIQNKILDWFEKHGQM